ncbi:hypothetical protein PV396_26800 [Streptomyces sp. ME02-8801-2C]|uniref:hypothetical protein n=1 Tax=Streptomyces sp. ME02-8801-2C TaxID=3028680 RepID=UPI0029AF6914|nr:hypothetical protein [Streptomyces sp. ME02-8801-2C]MDX3455502.1 hypothetical protein [Streptomyces sp. ME02-8801-2C]
MRIRATATAFVGALALSALAVPPASADGAVAAAEAAAPYALNASFSGIKINNGKSIVAGTTGTLTVPITYTLTHGTDVDITAEDFFTDLELYYGASYFDSAAGLYGNDWAHCTAASPTVAHCTQSIVVHPAEDLFNSTAGKWKAYAYVRALNGQDPGSDDFDVTKTGAVEKDGIAGPSVLRAAKLSVNASPEPVRKGATITVTGKLTRANWEAGTYDGYGNQAVKLQFRKNGTTAYTTLKTIRTAANGDLKTTVTATVDGFYRYVAATTTTTSDAFAAPDFVDVR